VKGSDADREVVVVAFDVDDSAFVGWVLGGFGVFSDAVGLQGFVSPVFVFSGGAVAESDSVVGVIVVVANLAVDELGNLLG